MNPPKGLHLSAVLFLALICYLVFFHGLGRYALWDPDEGRVGVIAKEMVASGNWVTLTQNGAPYYDKPVPYFWLVALCINLLGLSELAVRLPSALAAALTVGFVFLWGSVSGGLKRGLWSGVILATSMEFVALGRLGKMDMVFTFFFTAALLSFLRWKEHGKGSIWPFYLFLFLGLASLAKGPVGIILPTYSRSFPRWRYWPQMPSGNLLRTRREKSGDSAGSLMGAFSGFSYSLSPPLVAI